MSVCLSVCLWPQISIAALIFSSRLSSEPEAVIPRRTRKKYLQQNPEQEYKQWVALPPGGGGYSIYPWVARCGPDPHTLTLFKTNIADFPTLFKTELRFLIPCLRHLKLGLQEAVWLSCCVINGNLMCLVSMPKSTEVNINQQELVRLYCSSPKKRYPV